MKTVYQNNGVTIYQMPGPEELPVVVAAASDDR
jgi:hypothetical protein